MWNFLDRIPYTLLIIIAELDSRPVSRQVNAVYNNDSSNIRPLEQMELKL